MPNDLEYAVHLDGVVPDSGRNIYAHPSAAILAAQELKRGNPDDLVSIVLWPVTEDEAACCPDCRVAVGGAHRCGTREGPVRITEAVYVDRARVIA